VPRIYFNPDAPVEKIGFWKFFRKKIGLKLNEPNTENNIQLPTVLPKQLLHLSSCVKIWMNFCGFGYDHGKYTQFNTISILPNI
jgi:hypothetical protein